MTESPSLNTESTEYWYRVKSTFDLDGETSEKVCDAREGKRRGNAAAALEKLKVYSFECFHVSGDTWTMLVHMNILLCTVGRASSAARPAFPQSHLL